MSIRKLPVVVTALLFLLVVLVWVLNKDQEVDFSADIKPILNKHCISCHGGVKKNGGFSVLFEEEAFAVTESGEPAIIPGYPRKSELIKRLYEEDPEMRMPYHRPPLTQEEIKKLENWIKQGAKWGEHWAYRKVVEVKLPKSDIGFSKVLGESKSNKIDLFVFQKLKERNLSPSPQEEKMRLLRRLSLDITGLPPAGELVEKWKNNKISYEEVVDELLSSPAFGENMASWWLDLARYSDTKGYERDVSRTMWPYRDWVIRAFNDDMPFDRFTIEQLAGDLLPEPSQDQLIATSFHRNTMNNDEGGTEDEEFRVAAVLDRVNTTYEVWQSTTMACVQCHSHPYDPIRHEEYFQSLAFFNNSRDEDTHDEDPKLRMYDFGDKEKIEQLKNWLVQNATEEKVKFYNNFLHYQEPKYHAHLCQDFTNGELIDTKWLGLWHNGSAYLKGVYTNNSDRLLLNYWADLDGTRITIRQGDKDGDILSEFRIDKTKGRVTRSIPFRKIDHEIDLYISAFNPNAKPQQSTSAIVWFAFVPSLPGEKDKQHAEMEETFIQLLNKNPLSLPIMIENPDFMFRKTRVYERGNWLLQGQEVQPSTPQVFNSWQKEWPENRLGFAYWLTSKENPLTARTVVNRIWDQFFGRGLVNSLEDMGSQSDPPSHPELLDYLSYELMYEYNWSIKRLIKEIVLSHTYRQSSVLTAELYQIDPENKWYARGPRFRLSAEKVRDHTLAVSGLLSKKMYGKSVMPPQPEGIWQTVYNGENWVTSEGEDRYRRSLYTFLKRTSPYPSFISFDAGSREVCLSKRIVTNTPLQALVTLNDPVYFEAAIMLGKMMAQREGDGPKEIIARTYEEIMLVPISESKTDALFKLYQAALEDNEINQITFELVSETEVRRKEWAAFTIVANALLNMDEFLTKP
ncbi:PSD1 and planctomycete cytochrome C domain-containing protein [Shivajiella indica]|uniref:PSD1 and planctomycete cytochrome C domain-containing protein n=1 Tax=Shivajiella indica TaxID=872115 RepID=A0ABW5B5X8_9BACT